MYLLPSFPKPIAMLFFIQLLHCNFSYTLISNLWVGKVVMSFNVSNNWSPFSGPGHNVVKVELVKLGNLRIVNTPSQVQLRENIPFKVKWSSTTPVNYHNICPTIISELGINYPVWLFLREHGLESLEPHSLAEINSGHIWYCTSSQSILVCYVGVSRINIKGHDTDYNVRIQTNFKNIEITSYTEMYLHLFTKKKKSPISATNLKKTKSDNYSK